MILLVEDDAISRTALAETLRNAGHEVLEAVTGMEALALLDQNLVKLIVLDFVLPDLDGLKFLDRIGTRRPRIPVILVSGSLSQKAAEALLGMPGARTMYFVKAVRPSALVAIVQAFLNPY